MDISSYVLLSHEQALRRRLDVVANNIANASTVGFRKEQPVFREYVEQGSEAAVNDARKVSFVLDYGAVHDTTPGSFDATGNPLDVMIDGPGYLAVQTADGSTAYTRAGFIKILDSGQLATSGGQPILGEGGAPITIPPDQIGKIHVASDGSIVGTNGPLGRIAVTVFDNEASVDPRGDGLSTGQGGRELAANETKLRAGGVESSNVQPIVETTQMIDILRSYQMSQRMTEGIEDMRKRAIDRLGRIG